MNRRTALLALAGAAPLAAESGPSEDRIYRLEPQSLKVEDFPAAGLILDLGGGGEGIIGRLKGPQVVAIDLSRRELEEAGGDPLLKIVMDATELKFLDAAFPVATCFFTLMYVPEAKQAQVFREAHRVLAKGGRFLVWDLQLPTRIDPKRDIALCRFRFQLPREEVKTGYGAFFPDSPHDLAHYRSLAEAAGFRIARERDAGGTFFLELVKG